MKKRQIFILVLCAEIGFAQTDTLKIGTKFSNPILIKNESVAINQFPMQLFSPLTLNKVYKRNQISGSFPEHIIDYSVFSNYYVPKINLTDNLYNYISINNQSWINTSRTFTNYYGLGGMNFITGNYNTKIGNIGVFSAGIYVAKYNLYNNFNNDFGINGNFKVIITDNISMNIFGQYPFNSLKGSVPPLSLSLFPTTLYGGSFEFKMNENWGLMIGAENEFDVISRKWITKPFVMPLFYKH